MLANPCCSRQQKLQKSKITPEWAEEQEGSVVFDCVSEILAIFCEPIMMGAAVIFLHFHFAFCSRRASALVEAQEVCVQGFAVQNQKLASA